MIGRNFKYLSYVIFVLGFFISCSRIEGTFIEEGETVDMGLSMDIAMLDTDTKAIIDPDVDENTTVGDMIKNFWVIQYNGTGDNAVVIGEPKYYVYDDFVSSNSKIKLVASSAENVVFFIANTFDPTMQFSLGTTLGDLKRRAMTVSDQNSIFAKSGEDRYQLFNGMYSGVIQSESISVVLKRNIVKVSIEIVNSSDEVTITDWQMKQIPSLSYYVNNYELPESYPNISSMKTLNYDLVSVTGDGIMTKGESENYITYLPVNKRGIVQNSNESYKNYYAPQSATYLQINGSYIENGEALPISYLFYLGGDMEKDFNLLPNSHYHYTFEIKAKGSAESDYRVKEWGVVDFSKSSDELANCYIINPADINGYRRQFKIPVKRVDEFWGGKDGYEDVPTRTLGPSTDGKGWYVKLLVTNFDNSTDMLKLTKSSGTGSYDATTNELEYFQFSVDKDTRGNAIVAIYLSTDTEATTPLWSWHLWITDYAPDEAYKKTPGDDYIYEVTGGAVHRYDNGIWDGEYRNRFIMDRDLGAPNGNTYLAAGNGSCYFQFGRKDPFFGHNSTLYGGVFPDGVQYSTLASNGVDNNVLWSIAHPLTFVDSDQTYKYWTYGNKYNPQEFDRTMLWNDPNTSTQPGALARPKSIFDPCPPGYCVPKNGTWDDIKTNRSAKPTTNNNKSGDMKRNFPELDMENNLVVSYWPYPDSGSENNVPDNPIYLSVTGYKPGKTISGLPPSQAYILYHAANHSDAKNSYRKAIKYGAEDSPAANNKYWGYAVRCVTVRDSDMVR